MDTIQLLFIISNFMYVSTGPYTPEYSGILQLLTNIGFWTKSVLVWLFCGITLFSNICLIKLKLPVFVSTITAFLSLPWAIHLVFQEMRSQRQSRQIFIFMMIIPLTIMEIIVLLSYIKISPLYISHYCNQVLTLQNKTHILDLTRLLTLNILSQTVQGQISYLFIFSLNLGVTYYKISQVTFLNPRIQYTCLIMESWAWFSLVNELMSVEEFRYRILFQSMFLGLVYLSVRPPPQIVTLFEIKMEWNIRKFKKTNPIYYDAIVASYYAKIFQKKSLNSSDHLIECLSPSFIFFMKNQFESTLNQGKYSSLEGKSSRKLMGYDETIRTKALCDYFSKRRSFDKCEEKQNYQIYLLIYELLAENSEISISTVYRLYCLIYSSQKNLGFFQKINLKVCYLLVRQSIKSIKDIDFTRNDDLFKLQRLEGLIKNFLQNELTKQRKSNRQTNRKELKTYLDKRKSIRQEICLQIFSLKKKQIKIEKFLFLEFLTEKHIKCNPRIAMKQLKNKLSLTSQSIRYEFLEGREQNCIFMSTLPDHCTYIRHSNQKFKEILEYSQEYPLEIHDIIPDCLSSLHKAKLKKQNPANFEGLYEHSGNICYFKCLRSETIYAGKLQLKIHLDFNQMLILGICDIQTDQTIKIDDKQGKLEEILGKKFMIHTQYNRKDKIETEKREKQIISKQNLSAQTSFYLQQAEKEKDKINPLNDDLNCYGIFIGLAIGLIFSGIGFVEYNVLKMFEKNYKMNDIQNEFYRITIISEAYLSSLLCNYQLSTLYLAPQQLLIQKNQILNELELISEKFDNFHYLTEYFAGQQVIVSDMFEVIPINIGNQSSRTEIYFYQLIYKLHIKFQSLFSSMHQDQYDPKTSERFINTAQELLKTLQQTNLFEIASKNFKQSNKTSLIYRYIGYYLIKYVFNGFIVLYFFANVNLNLKIQNFLRKAQLKCQSRRLARNHVIKFQKLFRSIKRSQFKISDCCQSAPKVTQQQELNNVFQNKGNFFQNKVLLLIGLFLIISSYTIITANLNVSAYPKIIQNSSQIFDTKLQLTLLIINEVQMVQKTAIEILNSQNIWSQLYIEEKSKEYVEETNKLIEQTSIMEILSNFEVSRSFQVTENPCNSLIDCSELDNRYGEKTNGFVVMKNKIYILQKQIKQKRNQNTSYDQTFSTANEVKEVLKYSRKMIYLIDKLFELNTQLSKSQIEISLIKSLQINFVMVLLAIFIIGQFLRMKLVYEKYKTQIYMLLPLEELVKDQAFSKEINILWSNEK